MKTFSFILTCLSHYMTNKALFKAKYVLQFVAQIFMTFTFLLPEFYSGANIPNFFSEIDLYWTNHSQFFLIVKKIYGSLKMALCMASWKSYSWSQVELKNCFINSLYLVVKLRNIFVFIILWSSVKQKFCYAAVFFKPTPSMSNCMTVILGLKIK